MLAKKIIFKFTTFLFVFSLIFLIVKDGTIITHKKLIADTDSIPWLFSAISLIFSIISGFVIQSKWQTWNGLIDATRGELSSFRQLAIMAHHFPKPTEIAIRKKICEYLELVIEEAESQLDLGRRSSDVDTVLYELEDSIFIARKKYPQSGVMAFEILGKCMTYREQRLQNNAHTLPIGVRTFVIGATIAVIGSSLFIDVKALIYDYILTTTIALLSYGIYLLIDDLDHPYRPGEWHLKVDEYRELLSDVRKSE